MKALNILYSGKPELDSWIKNQELNDGSQCFIRIHSSNLSGDECVDLAKHLRILLPASTIVGCAVSGVIYNGEIVGDETLISIIRFNFGTIKSRILMARDMTTEELITDITSYAVGEESSLGFLFLGINQLEGLKIADALNEKVPNVPFVGGVTGYTLEDGSILSFVFDENGYYENACSISLISQEYVLSYTNIVNGHPAVSEEYTITAAHEDFVDEIDNKPAIEWLNQELGIHDFIENSDWKTTVAIDILLRFPLVLEGYNSTTRFMMYDSELNKIKLYFTSLDPGQKFRVGYLSPLRSAEQWHEICQEMQTVPAQHVFCYSCLFRKLFSNSIAEWEVHAFKDSGICGAFMLGEIGTKNGEVQTLHGACSFFTLSEKDEYIQPDLTMFDHLDQLIEANDDLIEQINVTKETLKSNYNNTIFDSLINYENEIKERFSQESDDKLKNMTQFLQEQSKNMHNQICLISIENAEKYFIVLGEDKFEQMAAESMTKILAFLQDAFPDLQFNYYNYDYASFLFTIEENVNASHFTEIVKSLYTNCGAYNLLNGTVACINNFTFTLTGLPVQRLVELSKSEDLEIGQRRFNLCDEYENFQKDLQSEFRMVANLNQVIKDNSVIPYFQGVYNNRKNNFWGYEALMRLQSPDGKILFPSDFLEISKKYQLYLPLSLCMVTKVLELFADRDEIVSINISPYDVLSEKFQDVVFEQLSKMEHSSHFIFELVETNLYEDLEALRAFILRAKKHGVKIALDDFGAGYSNFIEIGTLDLDYLKINGELIRLLGTHESYGQILDSITYMAKKMNVELIAEYVETASMQKQLVRNGIHYSQGSFFAKAISFEELTIEIEERKEKQEKQDSKSNDKFDISLENPKVKKRSKYLYWGGIIVGLITAITIWAFVAYNRAEIKDINDTFLVELADGLADKVNLFVEGSKTELQATAFIVSKHIAEGEDYGEELSQLATYSDFSDFYVSREGEQAVNGIGEEIGLDMDDIYGQSKPQEVTILSPLVDEVSNTEVLIFVVDMEYDGDKVGELYGKFELDQFSELLALKSFGGEAFYHLCEVDGTPIHLSGNSDNLFVDGDMYTFISSLDIYNGHTIESIQEDMEEGEDVLLNYYVNGQDRSAVMVRIPGTDWCVVSIVLSEVNLEVIEQTNKSTIYFMGFLITIYIIYFLLNVGYGNQTRKELVKALKESYYLTNTLQTSIETDSLTRAYSRAAAAEKISDIIIKDGETTKMHAVVLLDVDNFKGINDNYGHQTGDVYLQDFASSVRASLRMGDILGRLGGDEFVVLLNDVEDINEVERVVSKIVENVNKIEIRGVSLDNVSVSAGVAMVPEFGRNYETLSHHADTALYAAKNAGKNKYVFYSDGLS